MKKVLFVCYGNICRSPMAQMIFNHIVKINNYENEFIIDSAATSTEEIGNGLYYATIDILKEKNIDILEHKARRVTQEDYEYFDYIICFDNDNINTLNRMLNNHSSKIHSICEYIDGLGEVVDPWYHRNFLECYENIYKGCYNLFKSLI